ncbi:hypothetical protein [Vibrio splendidus]|uniref:Uncharacterized protein n=1 Tax=Vibrio splendidus TaxID=29497 RepID=A0A2T5E557_VIBSP|nr:hypothetical protein [Vibrio splendidus]OEE60126.1 hypothetical protein A147_03845 [Vibrio splendidus FF-6]PTP14450.1 hypothetical protein CWO36_21195 [Vibrio splendidus]UOE82171.1 hypothetical protein LTQ03_15690 [Vibrio splendidus]
MRLTTLQKLAKHYKTDVKHNKKAQRDYVEIHTDNDIYFVVCNGAVHENTLLVATETHNDYVKVNNNNKSFEALKTLFDEQITETVNETKTRARPKKKAVELFGELYEI